MDVQTTKPQELFFKERADTFELNVALVGEQKLIIMIKDFVDWIIYSRQYTEGDYCKEINRRMDLTQVYFAFAQTKPQCDEESMKEKQKQRDQLKKYQFGTVVENDKEKLPCYKIERGGRISVYLSMLDIRTKQQVTYESNLTLNKTRDMTQSEISTERSTIEKSQIFQELSREIQKEKIEKEELMKRVIKLQEENQRVKEELRTTKLELIGKDAEQEQKINQAKQSLEAILNSAKQELVAIYQQLQHQLNLTKSKLEARIESSQNELAVTKQELFSTKKELHSTKQELKQTNRELNENLQIQNQHTLDKFAEIQQNFKSIILMTLPQVYSNYFKVDGLKVYYMGNNDSQTQFIFNFAINHTQTANFKIKIAKTQNRYIMVGVVDYAKQKEKKDSRNSNNAMCYFGYNGFKYPSEGHEGDGFKQGDVVEVDVNRATSTIKYIINGVLKATHINNILVDNSRVFMAYVEMINVNDCVEWLM